LRTHFERASGSDRQSDGVDERIEIGEEPLIEAIELMALQFGDSARCSSNP
jgi:hypothetical protein